MRKQKEHDFLRSYYNNLINFKYSNSMQLGACTRSCHAKIKIVSSVKRNFWMFGEKLLSYTILESKRSNTRVTAFQSTLDYNTTAIGTPWNVLYTKDLIVRELKIVSEALRESVWELHRYSLQSPFQEHVDPFRPPFDILGI